MSEKKVKDGGYLILDDITTENSFGVHMALNEFVHNTNWKFKYITFPASLYINACLEKGE